MHSDDNTHPHTADETDVGSTHACCVIGITDLRPLHIAKSTVLALPLTTAAHSTSLRWVPWRVHTLLARAGGSASQSLHGVTVSWYATALGQGNALQDRRFEGRVVFNPAKSHTSSLTATAGPKPGPAAVDVACMHIAGDDVDTGAVALGCAHGKEQGPQSPIDCQ